MIQTDGFFGRLSLDVIPGFSLCFVSQVLQNLAGCTVAQGIFIHFFFKLLQHSTYSDPGIVLDSMNAKMSELWFLTPSTLLTNLEGK